MLNLYGGHVTGERLRFVAVPTTAHSNEEIVLV